MIKPERPLSGEDPRGPKCGPEMGELNRQSHYVLHQWRSTVNEAPRPSGTQWYLVLPKWVHSIVMRSLTVQCRPSWTLVRLDEMRQHKLAEIWLQTPTMMHHDWSSTTKWMLSVIITSGAESNGAPCWSAPRWPLHRRTGSRHVQQPAQAGGLQRRFPGLPGLAGPQRSAAGPAERRPVPQRPNRPRMWRYSVHEATAQHKVQRKVLQLHVQQQQ